MASQLAEAHHITAAGEIVVPGAHDIRVNSLAMADLVDALKRGYDDFNAKPSHMLVLGLIYPIGAGIVAGAALGRDFLPLVFPLASGLALLGPFSAIVLYEISRRRELGQEFSWGDIGDVVSHSSRSGVAVLMLALLAAFGLWLVAAQAIFNATVGPITYLSPVEFFGHVLTTPEGWMLILIGNGVGFLFAAAVLACNVVSFPMLLDRNVGAPAAVATSLRVAAKNPLIIAAWGLIIAGSLVAGALVFLVGLGVVVPVLGHASWHLYRKAVEPA